jgi:hypothetical protein
MAGEEEARLWAWKIAVAAGEGQRFHVLMQLPDTSGERPAGHLGRTGTRLMANLADG